MGPTEILQFALSGLTTGSIYALIALGFAVMLNATSLLNFAQGQFVMLGGMTVAVLAARLGWPTSAAIVATVAIVAGLNGLCERIFVVGARRADRISKELVTLGVGIIIESVVLLMWGADAVSLPYFSRQPSINVGPATMPTQALWIMGISLVAMAALVSFYRWTIHGQAMLACSMNREAASLMGIRPSTVATTSFVLGGALGALGGVLIVPLVPMSFSVGLSMSIKGFSALVVGGMGSIPGAIVGGLAIGLVESFSAGLLSSVYKEIVPMALIIVMLLVRPKGLLGGRG
ncbi:MAG: branched-chain amino acid ABC transporter permease [Alphaproteobacteria bacterium]